jgi:hypothetical protein
MERRPRRSLSSCVFALIGYTLSFILFAVAVAFIAGLFIGARQNVQEVLFK